MTNLFGFTLVELIVVITILVILGTIAFTSLTGYAGSARDSSRVSDLTNISKGLDISYIKTSSYPSPDSFFTVTYSGGNVWHQGTVGESVMRTISAAGNLKISKKPTDPLVNTNEYTYSKLAYGQAYQVKADWEGSDVVFLPHSAEGGQGRIFGIPQVQATSGNPTIAYIKGNYNGVVAKTQTGNITYILAIPSIISGTGSVGFILQIDGPSNLSGALLMHGNSNKTGISFNPKVVYSSGSLPSNDAERILFASGVAIAYSGTSLANRSDITPFINAIWNAGTLANLGCGLITNVLGGNCSDSAAETLTVTVPQYPSCTTPDILVGWKYWAACNVGATTVSASYVAGSDDSPLVEPESKRGKYFQWGEDIAWDYDGGVSSADNCTWDRDTQSCTTPTLSAWPWTISDGASGWANRWKDWSMTDTRGPCALGYHVPTQSEWNSVYTTLGSDRDTLVNTLKLPMAGCRYRMAGTLDGSQGLDGCYWSSSPFATTTNSYSLNFDYMSVFPTNDIDRRSGFSVRCLKD